MSNIPEFHFDFSAVRGMRFEEAAEALFLQMETHYNEHIKPAPILFGGVDLARPGADRSVHQVIDVELTKPAPVIPSGDLIRVKEDYEIKQGADLGLKDGYILTGVNDKDVEIFDYLKNYTPGDTVVEGESGKYDLGTSK